MSGFVYLLCFRNHDGSKAWFRGWSGHYLGWTDRTPYERIVDHQRGRNGAGNLPHRAFAEDGLLLALARVWSGDRTLERRLKDRKESPRLCPFCQGKSKSPRGKPV